MYVQARDTVRGKCLKELRDRLAALPVVDRVVGLGGLVDDDGVDVSLTPADGKVVVVITVLDESAADPNATVEEMVVPISLAVYLPARIARDVDDEPLFDDWESFASAVCADLYGSYAASEAARTLGGFAITTRCQTFCAGVFFSPEGRMTVQELDVRYRFEPGAPQTAR